MRAAVGVRVRWVPVAALVAVWCLSASSCASNSGPAYPDGATGRAEPEPQADGGASMLDGAAPAEVEPLGTEGLVAYDESIPMTAFASYEWLHDDLGSLAESSDLVFVGRVTDYVERVVVVPQSVEDPWGFPQVYDGVVFTVDELIRGTLPNDGSQVTIGTFAYSLNRDGSPRHRISDRPIGIVRTGIEQRNLPDGPRYLVYASRAHPDSVRHKPDLFFFNTAGGVVEIFADDSLGIGEDRPFHTRWRAVDGIDTPFDHGFDLDGARAAARVDEGDGGVPGGGPVDDLQEDDSGPVGTTGDDPDGSSEDGEAPVGTTTTAAPEPQPGETTTTSSTTTTTSTTSTVPPETATAAPAPRDVVVTPGDGTLTVTWTVASRRGFADGDIRHALRWSQEPGVWANPIDPAAAGPNDGVAVDGGVSSYTITGLTNGVATGVFVRSFTGGDHTEGAAASSPWVRVKGPHTTPTAVPPEEE